MPSPFLPPLARAESQPDGDAERCRIPFCQGTAETKDGVCVDCSEKRAAFYADAERDREED